MTQVTRNCFSSSPNRSRIYDLPYTGRTPYHWATGHSWELRPYKSEVQINLILRARVPLDKRWSGETQLWVRDWVQMWQTNSHSPSFLSTYLFIFKHTGKPRPGTCPSLTPPSEYCPSDFDECKYDWDCEGTTKKCCSNGCYRVCAEPAALGEVRGKFGVRAHRSTVNLVPWALSALKSKMAVLQGCPEIAWILCDVLHINDNDRRPAAILDLNIEKALRMN